MRAVSIPDATRDVPGETWWSYKQLLHGQVSRDAEDNLIPRGAPQNKVANCSDTEVQGDAGIFSRVWEAFVIKVVRFGKRGAK